jgi:hypothetical protein
MHEKSLHLCGHITFRTEDVHVLGRMVYDRIRDRFYLPHFTDVVTTWFVNKNPTPLVNFAIAGHALTFEGDGVVMMRITSCANTECAAGPNTRSSLEACECEGAYAEFGYVEFNWDGSEIGTNPSITFSFCEPELAVYALAVVYADDTPVPLSIERPEPTYGNPGSPVAPISSSPTFEGRPVYLKEDPAITGKIVRTIRDANEKIFAEVLWTGMRTPRYYTPDALRFFPS